MTRQQSYEALRDEVLRRPVDHEDDAVFIASLKARMDSIEKMRNAVAHNRRPSKKVSNDYLNALPLVNQALDDYLHALHVDWRDEVEIEQMPWDIAAHRAVKDAMETAVWDPEKRTLTVHDRDEPRIQATLGGRDELQTHLERVASSAFYLHCPRIDGEFLANCDEYGIVESVLQDYEDRLTDLFDSDPSGA